MAVIEASGWDTHANQGAEQGQLFARLQGLDRVIESLRVEMGDTWKNTVVMVATEFGRTVAIDGRPVGESLGRFVRPRPRV